MLVKSKKKKRNFFLKQFTLKKYIIIKNFKSVVFFLFHLIEFKSVKKYSFYYFFYN